MEPFVLSCKDPASHQQAVLQKLFALHGGADIVQRHGVKVPQDWGAAGAAGSSADGSGTTVHAVELLQQLPITTYADYEPLILDALEAGRSFDAADPACQERWQAAVGKLTGAEPYAFWCSSGTTGGQKRLPASLVATQSNAQAYGLFMQCMAAAFPSSMAGKDLRFSFAREIETMPNGVKVGVSSSITYRRWVETEQNEPMIERAIARWPSPKQVIVAGDARTCYYLHWLCALCCRRDITALSDIFAASVLLASNILVDHWPSLMADLAEGRCFSWLPAGDCQAGAQASPGCLPPPPAQVAAAVDARLSPSPELVAELQKVFDGGRYGLLERLFPNMGSLNCVLTGSMSKYVPHLRELMPTIPFVSSAYGATEGMFGVQSELIEYWQAAQAAKAAGQPAPSYADFCREPDGQTSYILMPQTDCYFEFIPYELAAEEQPATVSLEQLEEGQRYELVVSDMLGLFRYRVGDVVRCVGHFYGAPKVIVEGRSGQALNISGEKTPEAALVAAVTSAATSVLPGGPQALRDWAAREVVHAGAGAADTAGHYVIYWELAQAPTVAEASNGGSSRVPSGAELEAWAAALDAALAAASPDYQVFRRGSLSGLELRLVGAGAFEDLRQLAYRRGATAAQYKPPVTVKAEQCKLLEQHVLAAATCL